MPKLIYPNPLTYEALLQDLQAKKFSPLYLLEGEEPYYIDQVTQWMETQVLNESERSFNQFILYGKDTTAEKLLQACKTAPMMGNRTLVILKEAQMMQELTRAKAGEEPDSKKDKAARPASASELLEQYFLNPLPSTMLCICFKEKKLDRRNRRGKALDKQAVVLTTKKMYDDKLPEWIIQKAHAMQLKISPKSAMLLSEFIGTDLNRMENELQKLAITVQGKGEITAEVIERNIGISKDYNVFELQKALGARNSQKSFRIVQHFLHNEKEYPLPMTLASLYKFFWQLYLFHEVKGQKDGEIASAIGTNPFFVKDYRSAALHYPPLQCEKILLLLHRYDLRSKGMQNGETENGELLRELVIHILQNN